MDLTRQMNQHENCHEDRFASTPVRLLRPIVHEENEHAHLFPVDIQNSSTT